MIAVGEIRTSYGVKGELKVKSFADDPGSWESIPRLTLRDRKGLRERVFELEGCLQRGRQWTIKLKGLDNPEEARLFAGWVIWTEEEYASPCGDGEYPCYRLINSDVQFQGTSLGKVIGLVAGSPADFLEVEAFADGKRYLVPFRDEFIEDVDTEGALVSLRVDWIME